MLTREITHGHLFCGLGGGAKGFNKAQPRVGNLVGKFRCLGGIDVDPAGIRDFWLAAKYGKLSENWRDDLRQGLAECFRVLDCDGVLVFKWNETQVKLSEVLALTPHVPLFGNTSGKRAGTHWLVFMKPRGTA